MKEAIFSVLLINEVKLLNEKRVLEVKCEQLDLFDNLKK